MIEPTVVSDPKGPKNHCVKFNQDGTSLSVGSKWGYRLYTLSTIEKLEQVYINPTEDSCIVERLFNSSLVAVVAISAPRKLRVFHYKKGSEICNYSYSNNILAVRLNRARLVVCLEESLYIHDIRDMKVVHTIRDTPPNPLGICAMTILNDKNYVAYPGSAIVGEVQIFDAVNLRAKSMIHAHASPLAALAFTADTQRIATASEKGTVIRVFSVNDATKLFEFRRGVKRCVDISCLVFSMCGAFLACSSNTETVHIFKLDEAKDSPGTDESSWMGYLSTYLPTQVTDVFTQGRAFATAHLKISGIKNVIALTKIQQAMRLLVATEYGVLYIYNVESAGGDLQLLKEMEFGESHALAEAAALAARGDAEAAPLEGDAAAAAEPVESDKLREMAAAMESPPKDSFHFADEEEYPPLTQTAD